MLPNVTQHKSSITYLYWVFPCAEWIIPSVTNSLFLPPLSASLFSDWRALTGTFAVLLWTLIGEAVSKPIGQSQWDAPYTEGVRVTSQLYGHKQFTIITQKNMAWDLLHVKPAKLYSNNIWTCEVKRNIFWTSKAKNEMECLFLILQKISLTFSVW